MREHEQLTMIPGGEMGEGMVATFRVGAAGASLTHELRMDDEVRVTITDADGEVVCSSIGFVASVAFHKHRPSKGPHFTERIHKIKLRDDEQA